MNQEEKSLSISNPHPQGVDALQKISLAVAAIGLLIFSAAWSGLGIERNGMFLTISILTIIIGTATFGARMYLQQPAGIKNNQVFQTGLTNKGIWGWLLGIVLTGFYIELYWFPEYLGLGVNGASNTGFIALFDPLSDFFVGKATSQWFMYGTIYTLAIVALGIKFMFKYRNNNYQLIRTGVVIISQLFLAYLIPQILEGVSDPNHYFAKDIKFFWPLNYYFFDSWHIDNMVASGSLGMVFLIWGILGFLVVTPIITYFVGKRWYCSWVCGCGGLAETAGDPFRHLSSKKLSAWKFERWLIHGILVYIFLVTAVVLYGYFTGIGDIFGLSIYTYFSKPYSFLIGSIFSGVIGVGFYPVLGNRVWCRFGCPLAAYMGFFQRFKSRFRITTNGGQCISCGNCSTYCEQGIDVRHYAQKGQNIVRSSCVGCGICSSVCPRGVLKLENGSNDDSSRTYEPAILLGNDGPKLNL